MARENSLRTSCNFTATQKYVDGPFIWMLSLSLFSACLPVTWNKIELSRCRFSFFRQKQCILVPPKFCLVKEIIFHYMKRLLFFGVQKGSGFSFSCIKELFTSITYLDHIPQCVLDFYILALLLLNSKECQLKFLAGDKEESESSMKFLKVQVWWRPRKFLNILQKLTKRRLESYVLRNFRITMRNGFRQGQPTRSNICCIVLIEK